MVEPPQVNIYIIAHRVVWYLQNFSSYHSQKDPDVSHRSFLCKCQNRKI